eukprot:s3570_g5.t1
MVLKMTFSFSALMPLSDVKMWLGTSDDWIGEDDRPTKETGDFHHGFVPSKGGKILRVQSGEEQVFAFSPNPGSKAIILQHYGNWPRVYASDQSDVSRSSSDGAYAIYALYQCNQQSDESHDSYLARADVLWSKLKTQKLQLEDLQAYITLRGAQLSSDDKKRIILDSDQSLEGKLTVNRVQEAVRMLGTSFFHDMTGAGRKQNKSKVYDSLTMVADDHDGHGETEDQAHSVHDEWHEDDILEALLAEGDEDAVFITDYEAACNDLVQSDEDLSAAFSTYVEARRKLNEKFRSRGFWPLGKGKGRSTKGKSKGKFNWSSRKTLQQRILDSNCRICGKRGHWRNECPNRPQGASSTPSTAAVTLSVAMPASEGDLSMPDEFLLLPEVSQPTTQDILSKASHVVQSVFYGEGNENAKRPEESLNMSNPRDKIRSYIEGRYNTNFGVKTLVHRIEQKLLRQKTQQLRPLERSQCILHAKPESSSLSESRVPANCPQATESFVSTPVESPSSATADPPTEVLFSTHDTWGILDTGATKTVMGSEHVKEFLDGLMPDIKPHVKRSTCDVVFRFGNQGTLRATHALILPVGGMWLKIAVVKGATPFLISNTLLRALGAIIDTSQHILNIPKHQAQIQLQLSPKGLYLLDMNQLTSIAPVPGSSDSIAETFAQDSFPESQKCDTASNPLSAQVNKVDKSSRHGATMLGQSQKTCSSVGSAGPSEVVPKVSWSEPVIRKLEATPPNNVRFCDQETCAPIHPLTSVPVDHEQQLDSALVQGPSPCSGASGRGTDRSLDPDRVETDHHELRQGPHRPNVRRSLAVESIMDQVVPRTLCDELKARSSEDDQIHPDEDRGVRSRVPTTQCKELASRSGSTIQEPSQEPSQAQCDRRDADRARGGDPRDDVRGRLDASQRHPGRDPCTEGSHDVHGSVCAAPAADDAKCPERAASCADAHARSLRDRCCRLERHMEQLNAADDTCHWALKAGEIDAFCSSDPNKESIHFWQLVNQMESEITKLAKIIKPAGSKIDLLEAFCHSDSSLSSQMQQLRGSAKRHGLNQGDLMTTEGRRVLFTTLLRFCPKHVWVSPTCGPWGMWSNFNSLRSIQSWDKIHAARWEMLCQVALCLVLCRHQHRRGQHAHWEQPKGSLMMKLPYVQEIFRYMMAAMPDLCRAGDFQDPATKLPIKKGLQIMTTSKRLFQAIDHLKCSANHVHQVIEGSTKLHGVSISRSQFSERYPRKFARLIAKTLSKNSFPCEKPVGAIADPVLTMFDLLTAEANANAASERPAKRLKKTPNRGVKNAVTDDAPEQTGESKRSKKTSPESHDVVQPDTASVPNLQVIGDIMKRVEAILPRVGKKQIDSPSIMSDLQGQFPDMIIKKIVACKGTDRRWGPPSSLNPSEAPFRRSIMKIRQDMNIVIDPTWEQYDVLSNRQIIRKSPSCRVNITLFATTKAVESHVGTPAASEMPCGPIHAPASSDSEGSLEIPQNESSAPLPIEPGPNPDSQIEAIPGEDSETSRMTAETVPWNSKSSPESKSLPDHGPRFKALPKEEQAMLKRAHQNLCHPSHEQLSTVLRNQGCRLELTQAVFDMHCPVCISCQKPKIARPSTFKDALDFNDKVFIDGITWTSKLGHAFHFYHFLDQATNFHVAIPAPSRSADQAILKVSEAWFNWAGPPNTLVMDSATEFTSEMFQEFLQKHDVKDVVTSPHAHWQNGRCERHGQILQSMLTKLDHEQSITSFQELQQALIQCTHAKNSLSIRKGYSPEILVFGKSSKLPGSVTSCDEISSHASASREDAHGIEFRQKLALRERARVAFHKADNDMSLRRACLRRSRPDRQGYSPGEWIMMWQPQSNNQGYWFGPLKVVQQEDNLSVWATKGGRLHRRAPEHVRPVSSAEAREIPAEEMETFPDHHQNQQPDVTLPENPIPTSNNNINNPGPIISPTQDNVSSPSEDQPDTEPEENSPEVPPMPNYIDTPVPNLDADDDLVTTHLLCCDDEVLTVDPVETPCAWRFEVEVPNQWSQEDLQHFSADEILLASTEKQKTEVRLSMLNAEEKKAFQEAKQTEIKNWLATGTVSKILRSKLAPEQILRCRWLLVWKDKESPENNSTQSENSVMGKSKLQTHKPKARLVVLGYLDPNLTEVPRDSPTLGRQSKMLLLQLIASNGWSLGSFDIKAAFLQGRPNQDRIMGLEPVPELAEAMRLSPAEICKLDKSAYGLIDAPYLWFKTLCDELVQLGMQPSPFDPCLYILRHPKTGKLSGALGVHVDDGIHGGDDYFHQQIAKLEAKYPFGSKKSRSFTFTGIDMQQFPDNSIQLSQTKYVNSIQPISLSSERRLQENAEVTEPERHMLRGLVGSLQYAAVHTRPDISSSLSHLQSQINKATVSTLLTANKVLHNAKKHSDVSIKIQPIAIEDVRFIAFSDASFASKSKPESHAGMIILATHKDISQNKSCAISPLSWGTKKIQRIVTSTLSAETSALSTSLDQLTWMRLYWAWLLDPSIPWQKPDKITNLPQAISIPTYKANEHDLAITDCKSLYDLTTRTAIPNCQEFRTQLLARSIKDVLAEGIKLHWVHSGAQLADALTKMMEAHFLRETLRQGRYCLHDAEEVPLGPVEVGQTKEATIFYAASGANQLERLAEVSEEADEVAGETVGKSPLREGFPVCHAYSEHYG